MRRRHASPPPTAIRAVRSSFSSPKVPAAPVTNTARAVGEYVGQRLGQALVVDNKSGAGGIVATEAAAQAVPDGYTLYLSSVAPIAGRFRRSNPCATIC